MESIPQRIYRYVRYRFSALGLNEIELQYTIRDGLLLAERLQLSETSDIIKVCELPLLGIERHWGERELSFIAHALSCEGPVLPARLCLIYQELVDKTPAGTS